MIPGLDIIAGTALPLASAYGSYRANKENISLSRENRAWQEQMSNTAYQRSMADMKKAGLNPMLAYMKGGASTPPGGAAQSKNIAEGAATAMQVARTVAETNNIKANTALTRAKTIPLATTGSAITNASNLGNKAGQWLGNTAAEIELQYKIARQKQAASRSNQKWKPPGVSMYDKKTNTTIYTDNYGIPRKRKGKY